jgi:hypothetical protein
MIQWDAYGDIPNVDIHSATPSTNIKSAIRASAPAVNIHAPARSLLESFLADFRSRQSHFLLNEISDIGHDVR